MNPHARFVDRIRIAYFTMEIALRPEIHTYSGGLGVLAGDSARSCADLGLPVVFVSLISRSGYVRQALDTAGQQLDATDPWDPAAWLQSLDVMVSVQLRGRMVWIKAWLFVIESGEFGTPVILLDTDVAANDPADRAITERLYGGDNELRLRQEVVLGIGGERLLRALGFNIRRFHLNEGHAAFLPLSLLAQAGGSSVGHEFVPAIRERCVFTTHTPVEAGHDRFAYDMVREQLGTPIPDALLRDLAGEAELNTTKLALNLSRYVNGVAERHAETTARMFRDYEIHAITNGIHLPTWIHPAFAALYDRHAPGWQLEPSRLSAIDQCDGDDIWAAHMQAKQELCAWVGESTGVALRPELPIIVYARRMTGYKRPDLIFTDRARLAAIARRQPFQLVFAGKAHPRDSGGKDAIRRFAGFARTAETGITATFVPNYDMAVSHRLVAGADIWLNTPLPPLEASGTSGMKAAVNGVLNCSILDGWWLEGWIEGVTGWAIGSDGGPSEQHAAGLYEKLGDVILPLYTDRPRWIWMMQQAISKIGPRFNSHNMMRRYAAEAYFR